MEHYQDESLNHNSQKNLMKVKMERPDYGSPLRKKPYLPHTTMSQPLLTIEVSDPSTTSEYNPQVKAISPVIDKPMPEYKKPTNEIIPKLNKIYSNINSTIQESEDSIKSKEYYKQKRMKLEVTKIETKKHTLKKECKEEDPIKNLTSVPKQIDVSNRKKACVSKKRLEKFDNKTDLPLNNQPSDAENKRNAQKQKQKDAKYRKIFEKEFPVIKKAREDKERFNRICLRVRNDTDLEAIMDDLKQEQAEEQKMRSNAVIPPQLLDPRERNLTHLNDNGLVKDYKTEYNETNNVNIWTQQEKEVFKNRFIDHPKNFDVIASYLENKSPSDCIKYYYLSKHKEKYKTLIPKTKRQAQKSSKHMQIVS